MHVCFLLAALLTSESFHVQVEPDRQQMQYAILAVGSCCTNKFTVTWTGRKAEHSRTMRSSAAKCLKM